MGYRLLVFFSLKVTSSNAGYSSFKDKFLFQYAERYVQMMIGHFIFSDPA